ncbi:hypothetical protein EB796_007987 [Bugula neritina]|uniref:Uncharacterized protein n=1 Tax=Bugula neritina TaxID=10212 RepID=A0A7J7K7V7_BUGNE|nr:hypothetical protein EB796_007987 [Bugula neritina]
MIRMTNDSKRSCVKEETSEEKGKLTTEEDFGQRKDSFAVFWDYVKAGGGCSSIMVVAFVYFCTALEWLLPISGFLCGWKLVLV